MNWGHELVCFSRKLQRPSPGDRSIAMPRGLTLLSFSSGTNCCGVQGEVLDHGLLSDYLRGGAIKSREGLESWLAILKKHLLHPKPKLI